MVPLYHLYWSLLGHGAALVKYNSSSYTKVQYPKGHPLNLYHQFFLVTEIPLKTVVHITKDNIHIYFFFARQNKGNTGDVFFNRGKIHNNVNIGYNKLTLKTL